MRRNDGPVYVLALGIVAVFLLTTGPGHAQSFGGGPVAERYFRIDFAPAVAASGRRVLWGHVYNSYYRGARNVSLLVEGLDSGNRPVGQTIGYVNGDIPGEGRRYFEVAAPTPGTTFRVSVLYFDWVPGGDAR